MKCAESGSARRRSALSFHPVTLISGPGLLRPASLPSIQLFVTSWAEPRGGGQAEKLQEVGCPEAILRLQVLTASGPGEARGWGRGGGKLKFSSNAHAQTWGAQPPSSWARP